MPDITKCDKCSKAASFHIKNPSAADQDVCESHLPWIYQANSLPENVTRHTIKEKVKDESRENTDKTSTSSAKQDNAAKGTLPTGSTSPAKNNP